eukprot:Platyproteum_vivax@DN17255_c0_g1_i1.p1
MAPKVNLKAQEAMARKTAASNAKVKEKEKLAEDAKWRDDGDKRINAKMKRQEDAVAKSEAQRQRKLETQKLYDQEQSAEPIKHANKTTTKKITQSEISQRMLASMTIKETPVEKPAEVDSDEELPPNPNRVINKLDENKITATGLDGAVSIFQEKEATDLHPEKRLKAAHKAYEEMQLPILKAEYPSLKRSKLQDMIWKQWQKAPENPLNQI